MWKSTMERICNKVIEFSFYALFLLVPLSFTSLTSELYEMNKMWLTWGITILIAMAWFTKMIIQKKLYFQKTPLDIPIALFLLSQIISTIFSLDFHVSLWGYYSRFNGGLFSIISYIFLYYAFVTFISERIAKEEGSLHHDMKLSKSHWQEGLLSAGPRFVKRLLFISLIAGLIVALWGLPSHFGYDPTCLLFRGTFDVSCWTAEFMPKVRIFSTLGQPDWLAAYLCILIPISFSYAVFNWKTKARSWKLWIYLIISVLFYIDLLYTRARSGFIAIWFSLAFFIPYLTWVHKKKFRNFVHWRNFKTSILVPLSMLLLVTFVTGSSISFIDRFTLRGLGEMFAKKQTITKTEEKAASPTKSSAKTGELGGTDSGKIRLLVWEGAMNAWKNNSLFGTGVETFAYAYYKYKPAGQNLTSEWNFLYNKAHNEYLNYLATTGSFGLLTYLSLIGAFLYVAFKDLKNIKEYKIALLTIAIIAAYISILITDFFGFSVVITNIYLFMIPAFVFVLTNTLKPNSSIPSNNSLSETKSINIWQSTQIFFILIIGIFMLYSLVRYWRADTAYALGYNLNRSGSYEDAYLNLHKAVKLRGDEPVFKDELSINDALIAVQLASQKSEDPATQEKIITTVSSLVQEAIEINNEVISQHSNNPVFWKTRVRLFYTLSQVDSRYLPRALDAIEKASLLAPQDANILYNLGVLYGQNNHIDEGISTLEKTIALKPNYRDAHFGLGLFYRQKAVDKDNRIADPAMQEKAVAQMQYILDNISPEDADALSSLESWAK